MIIPMNILLRKMVSSVTRTGKRNTSRYLTHPQEHIIRKVAQSKSASSCWKSTKHHDNNTDFLEKRILAKSLKLPDL